MGRVSCARIHAFQGIRTASEWRRWEEANKWSWEGTKRKRWAESLWRRQQIRRLQKRAFKENQAKAEARYKYEQHQEAKRRARWGYREQNFFAGNESNCLLTLSVDADAMCKTPKLI